MRLKVVSFKSTLSYNFRILIQRKILFAAPFLPKICSYTKHFYIESRSKMCPIPVDIEWRVEVLILLARSLQSAVFSMTHFEQGPCLV